VALSGFCFPVLTAYSFGIIESLEDLLRSKITLNEIIPSIFWHVKIAFSMYMGAGGFIPTLPNLYTVFIYSFSLIIVCFFLLSLFIKQNNKMITEASN